MASKEFTKLRACVMAVSYIRNFSAMPSPRIWRVYDDGYIVRNPSSDDIDIIKSWRLKGKNPFPNDLNIVHKVLQSKPGIYVGEYHHQLVSCALYLKWGDVYNASYFYVLPEYRYKNFGYRIHDLGIRHVSGVSIVGHSHLHLVDKHTQNGWKATFRIIHYEGRADRYIIANHNNNGYGVKIVKASDIDFEKLMAYDRRNFASTIESSLRKHFMKEITFSRDGSSYVALNKEKNIVGIGYQRACTPENIALIGPIYADTAKVSEILLLKLLNDISGKNYVAYVYEPNSEATDLFKRMGATSKNIYKRIYMNKNPNEYRNTVICCTSPDVCIF